MTTEPADSPTTAGRVDADGIPWPTEPPPDLDPDLDPDDDPAAPAPPPAPQPPPGATAPSNVHPLRAPADRRPPGRTVPVPVPSDLAGRSPTAMGAPVPEGYTIPDPYRLTPSGVWLLHHKHNRRTGTVTQTPVLIASAPCLVAGVLRDDDGDELVELAWLHYGRWRRRAVARSVARHGRRLLEALGDAGFPVTASTGSKLEAWLDAVEVANRQLLGKGVTAIARTLGWQADHTFVAASGQPRPVHPRIANLDAAIAAHKPAGTLADWQRAVQPLGRHPKAQMGLYAGLAATLLRPLGLDSFTLDYSGLTTTGKTTAAEAALSPFGDPHALLAKWNATRVAMENRLAIVRGIPVVLDETSNALSADVVRDMLYAIPQNRAKDRGSLDGSRPSLPWLTVVITTGERSILTFTRDGGTAARVLEVTGSPFGDDGHAARAVRDGVYAHHGTAGPAFVEHLTAMLASDHGTHNLQTLHRQARDGFARAAATDLARRRAPLVAALWVAASLARQWAILPFDPPPVQLWRALFDAQEAADDRPGEALQLVHNWYAANQAAVWGSASMRRDSQADPIPPVHGWAGVVVPDSQGGGFALRPEVVARILAEQGYELDAVKQAWVDRGTIRRQGRHLTRARRLDGAWTRLLEFIPSAEPEPTPE